MARIFKRFGIAAITAVSMAALSTVAIATTTAGSTSLRNIAGTITRMMPARTAIDAIAAGGGGVSSSPGVTITIAPTATLTARLLVQGKLTITCGPLFNFGSDSFAGGQGFISVQEAVGNQVADGNGSFSFVCSGAPQTVSYSATPFNVPYHPGTAVADASFFMVCGTSTPFGFDFVCVQGDSGPTLITIRPST